MRNNLRSPANLVKAHILLPKGKACTAVLVDGSKTAFKTVRVADSVYADVEVTPRGAVDFRDSVLNPLIPALPMTVSHGQRAVYPGSPGLDLRGIASIGWHWNQ